MSTCAHGQQHGERCGQFRLSSHAPFTSLLPSLSGGLLEAGVASAKLVLQRSWRPPVGIAPRCKVETDADESSPPWLDLNISRYLSIGASDDLVDKDACVFA
jgi:hypothetical protein